jgi:hypothetical protein
MFNFNAKKRGCLSTSDVEERLQLKTVPIKTVLLCYDCEAKEGKREMGLFCETCFRNFTLVNILIILKLTNLLPNYAQHSPSLQASITLRDSISKTSLILGCCVYSIL